MSPFILLPVVFFAAGFMQGLTGFGSALIAMPLLAYVVDIKTAVAVCTLCGVIINFSMCCNLRSNIEINRILPLIIGCVPGVVFGTVVLREVDGGIITLCLGILVAGYASYSLLVNPVVLKMSRLWGYLAGFLTGAIGTAVSAGGPPTIIYSSLMGWRKDDFKATLSGFFLVAASMAALGHFLGGLTTLYVFKLFLASLIPVQAGVMLGHRLAARVSEDLYRRIVMILLVFMGLMLIFQNA